MDDAVSAEVIDLLQRSGAKGVLKVKCKVIEGKDTGKVLVRNVIGPVKLGDFIMLKETEIEGAGGGRRR